LATFLWKYNLDFRNITWISSGATEVWRINSKKKIEFCTDGTWNRINGVYQQVSVGENEVWGVNPSGVVFMSPLPFESFEYFPDTRLENILFMV
jgi:hypothetical protein